jgi:hypothetical protein
VPEHFSQPRAILWEVTFGLFRDEAGGQAAEKSKTERKSVPQGLNRLVEKIRLQAKSQPSGAFKPVAEKLGFVSGHDFSRARNNRTDEGFSP